MSEAECRKATAPRDEKSKRGIVVSPPMVVDGNTITVASAQLDPQQLRSWLLFFDQLVWPASRALYLASGDDELFLESCNILSRPDYTFMGDMAAGIARGQIKAFSDLSETEPGKWLFAEGDTSFMLKENVLSPQNGMQLELYGAIPVPNKDVPLAEILEFKSKRYDELERLRLELDTFVLEMDKSENPGDVLEGAISKIDAACSDLLRLGSEWQWPVLLSNVSTTFEFRPLVTAVAAVGGYFAVPQSLGTSTALLSSLGTAFVATAPSLKISAAPSWVGLKRPAGPYRYVQSYHNQLF